MSADVLHETERRVVRDRPPDAAWPGRRTVMRKNDGVVAGTLVPVAIPDGDGEVEVGWRVHPGGTGIGLPAEGPS